MREISDPTRGASEPGRFWTVANVGEATPDVLTPMCWSVWEEPLELAFRRTLADFGALRPSDVRFPADQNQQSTGCFFGRQAINVDLTRTMLARLPGVSADEFERDILGSVRPGLPPEPGATGRIPAVMVKSPAVMLRTHAMVHGLYGETTAWWRREVLGSGGAGRPLDRLTDSRSRFGRAMHAHIRARFLVQTVQGTLIRIATKAGEPRLGSAVMAGYGNVAETEMADDVWRIAHGELDERTFLERYGFHGTNEGNPCSRTWREDPERVRAMADSHARRPDAARPKQREAGAIEARLRAEAELLAAVPRAARPGLGFLLRRGANLVRNLELGKATFLMTLDGTRAATRALGAELVTADMLDDIDDAFYLTVPEHGRLAGGGLGHDPREVVAFRRQRRKEYAQLSLPHTFTGMPEPIAAAPDGPVAPDAGGRVVTGVAASAGRVEGRARVVLDPDADVVLEPGDVLVCRITDPSWAPLFTLAEALVIDIGGPASHGAIVARELGIPCVIGTGNGTTAIHDGDRITVDGDAGTVSVLS
ncbi:MAG: phosphoenolpyruvate-utilizing protein [Actinobacteria bacterium]|nr:phosphoenolpyruvate-utilizing protein [Actinomycetota bacterium]